MNKTKKITTSALLTALSVVLMFVSKLIPAPWLQGGSVTLASMTPIIAVSFLYGVKWGLSSSMIFSLIQIMTGFYPPPTQTLTNYFLVIFLDYIAAYGILGTAHFFYSLFGKRKISVFLSAFTVTLIRYFCHILSGILIWGVYAGESQSILIYSILYNGSYMIPEIIITTACSGLLSKYIVKRG